VAFLPIACRNRFVQAAAVARKKKLAAPAISGPDALRAWRQRTQTSQKQLAKMLNFKHNTSVSWYELGRLPMTFPSLIELQRLTGISIWTLATDEQRQVMREIQSALAAAANPEAMAG